MRTKILVGALVLVAGVAAASAISSGGSGGGNVDVLAALIGQNVNADSYRATTATGPGFQCTQDTPACIRLGSGTRDTITGDSGNNIYLGPNDGSNATGVYISGFLRALGAQLVGQVDLLGDNAYMTNNAGVLRFVDPDGVSFNDTTPLKGRVAATVTFNSASINAGTCLDQTVTVTGALVGDFVTSVSANFSLVANVAVGNARVTATDTLELRLCNNDLLLPRDPASGPYNIVLER